MSVLRTLHHFPLDPASRQVRLVLGEKKLAFTEMVERPWEASAPIKALNPSGQPPVLIESEGGDKLILCESRAILDHLEERKGDPALLPRDAAGRGEARRLIQWFDRKFDFEVNALLIHEKMEKRLMGLGAPDLGAMRAGREALRRHFTYMDGLLDTRTWLAGSRLSLADIAAAAHLSVIDYFGDCPWDDFPSVKTWYMKIKSRPSFRPLLGDRWPGLAPASHYDNLDF